MSTTPTLPRDFEDRKLAHGEPIQVLAPEGTTGRMTVSDAASDRVGPFPTGAILSIWSEITCFFLMGDVTVVATTGSDSDPLTAQQREFYHLGANTHVAAIGFPGTGTGVFHVRVLE